MESANKKKADLKSALKNVMKNKNAKIRPKTGAFSQLKANKIEEAHFKDSHSTNNEQFISNNIFTQNHSQNPQQNNFFDLNGQSTQHIHQPQAFGGNYYNVGQLQKDIVQKRNQRNNANQEWSSLNREFVQQEEVGNQSQPLNLVRVSHSSLQSQFTQSQQPMSLTAFQPQVLNQRAPSYYDSNNLLNYQSSNYLQPKIDNSTILPIPQYQPNLSYFNQRSQSNPLTNNEPPHQAAQAIIFYPVAHNSFQSTVQQPKPAALQNEMIHSFQQTLQPYSQTLTPQGQSAFSLPNLFSESNNDFNYKGHSTNNLKRIKPPGRNFGKNKKGDIQDSIEALVEKGLTDKAFPKGSRSINANNSRSDLNSDAISLMNQNRKPAKIPKVPKLNYPKARKDNSKGVEEQHELSKPSSNDERLITVAQNNQFIDIKIKSIQIENGANEGIRVTNRSASRKNIQQMLSSRSQQRQSQTNEDEIAPLKDELIKKQQEIEKYKQIFKNLQEEKLLAQKNKQKPRISHHNPSSNENDKFYEKSETGFSNSIVPINSEINQFLNQSQLIFSSPERRQNEESKVIEYQSQLEEINQEELSSDDDQENFSPQKQNRSFNSYFMNGFHKKARVSESPAINIEEIPNLRESPALELNSPKTEITLALLNPINDPRAQNSFILTFAEQQPDEEGEDQGSMMYPQIQEYNAGQCESFTELIKLRQSDQSEGYHDSQANSYRREMRDIDEVFFIKKEKLILIQSSQKWNSCQKIKSLKH